MSKQARANRMFIEKATAAFYKTQQNLNITDFCEWLIKSAILPETVLNKWLAVMLYKTEIQRTKSKVKPRGVKWLALQNTLQPVPICEKTLRTLVKSHNLPKSDYQND